MGAFAAAAANSGSPKPVSRMIGIGRFSTIRSAASSPVSSGMRMSRIARSTGSRAAISTASRPLRAGPTTRCPSASSWDRRANAFNASSSAMRILSGVAMTRSGERRTYVSTRPQADANLVPPKSYGLPGLPLLVGIVDDDGWEAGGAEASRDGLRGGRGGEPADPDPEEIASGDEHESRLESGGAEPGGEGLGAARPAKRPRLHGKAARGIGGCTFGGRRATIAPAVGIGTGGRPGLGQVRRCTGHAFFHPEQHRQVRFGDREAGSSGGACARDVAVQPPCTGSPEEAYGAERGSGGTGDQARGEREGR